MYESQCMQIGVSSVKEIVTRETETDGRICRVNRSCAYAFLAYCCAYCAPFAHIITNNLHLNI